MDEAPDSDLYCRHFDACSSESLCILRSLVRPRSSLMRRLFRRLCDRFWARQAELAERDRIFRQGCERAADREEWQHPMIW